MDVFRIVLAYAVVASAWMGLSDGVLSSLLPDDEWRTLADAITDQLFVAVTALLLYVLVSRLVRRAQHSRQQESDSRSRQQNTASLLRAIAENSTDAIFAKDLQGRYLLCNKETARLLGRPAAEVIGQDDRQWFSPELAAIVRSNDVRVMGANRVETFEEVVNTVDGQLTFLATKGPLHDDDGRVTGMFGISRNINDRITAHQQVVAARDELREVLGRIDDGLLALDRQWRVVYANARAAQLLSLDAPEALLGRVLWEAFPDADNLPFRANFEAALATQQTTVAEGHYGPLSRWFETRCHPSTDGLSIYFRDVTARRLADAALRDSEDRLRMTVEMADIAIWEYDFIRNRMDRSDNHDGLYGLAQQASWDVNTFLDATHPDDRETSNAIIQASAAPGGPDGYSFDFRVTWPDASLHWLWVKAKVVQRDAAGQGTVVRGVLVDITERKVSEAALRKNEATLQAALESMSDAVAITDLDGNFVHINSAFATFHKFRSKEECAKTQAAYPLLLETFRVDGTPLPAKLWAVPAALRGKSGRGAEFVIQRKDTGERWIGSYNFAPIRDAQGDIVGSVVTGRDITAQRAAEQALITHQFELSELTHRLLTQEKQTTRRVAQALHDQLGQTLAVARLTADATMASLRAAMTPGVYAALGRIVAQLDKAVHVVRDLLTELRPPLLDDEGLQAALANEIDGQAQATGQADVLLEADELAPDLRWPADVEYAAFMVAREAIVNALVHAHATLIRVVLAGDAETLRLQVIDDGTGDPGAFASGRQGHLGIVGMRERAAAIGARLDIGAAAAERGVCVSLAWQAHKP